MEGHVLGGFEYAVTSENGDDKLKAILACLHWMRIKKSESVPTGES